MKIYKFPLTPFEVTEIEVPAESQALSVLTQGEQIMLYVRISGLSSPKTMRFIASPTGEASSAGIDVGRFIGTTTIPNGIFPHGLVFHIFEVSNV